MSVSIRNSALAGFACLLLGSTSAYAVDGKVFADRLVQALSNQSLQAAYKDATTEGANVTLTEMTVTSGGDNIQLGNVTFENVTGSNEEGWSVERVPFKSFENTTDKTTVKVGDSVVEGLKIKGTGAQGAEQVSDIYLNHAMLGTVEVTEGGKRALTVSNVQITNTDGEGGAISTEFSLGDFDADFTAGENVEGLATLQELGYAQMKGSISGSGSWTPNGGELSLDSFDINVENAGSFSMSYAITGYTKDFIQSLQQMQAQMASGATNNESAGMAVMGLLSQLSIGSMSIAYVDDSLAPKLLDYFAKQNNQSRDDLVASLVGALPLALGYLQNPEFQAQATGAVETFLKNPQSLTISADPQNPVAVTQIFGAAMGAPQTLPQLLTLSVSANDADEDGDGDGSAN